MLIARTLALKLCPLMYYYNVFTLKPVPEICWFTRLLRKVQHCSHNYRHFPKGPSTELFLCPFYKYINHLTSNRKKIIRRLLHVDTRPLDGNLWTDKNSFSPNKYDYLKDLRFYCCCEVCPLLQWELGSRPSLDRLLINFISPYFNLGKICFDKVHVLLYYPGAYSWFAVLQFSDDLLFCCLVICEMLLFK